MEVQAKNGAEIGIELLFKIAVGNAIEIELLFEAKVKSEILSLRINLVNLVVYGIVFSPGEKICMMILPNSPRMLARLWDPPLRCKGMSYHGGRMYCSLSVCTITQGGIY